MHGIRIHGRGGQGAKLAAQLLIEAALLEGKQVQAFPEYGPERSGAPVVSYARISKKSIRTHQPVKNPGAVLVLDPSLVKVVDLKAGLDKNSILIINSSANLKLYKKYLRFRGKAYTISASNIALKLIGRDKPNTALLGALVQIKPIVKLASLQKVMQKYQRKLGPKVVSANIRAMEEGYKRVKQT